MFFGGFLFYKHSRWLQNPTLIIIKALTVRGTEESMATGDALAIGGFQSSSRRKLKFRTSSSRRKLLHPECLKEGVPAQKTSEHKDSGQKGDSETLEVFFVLFSWLAASQAVEV